LGNIHSNRRIWWNSEKVIYFIEKLEGLESFGGRVGGLLIPIEVLEGLESFGGRAGGLLIPIEVLEGLESFGGRVCGLLIPIDVLEGLENFGGRVGGLLIPIDVLEGLEELKGGKTGSGNLVKTLFLGCMVGIVITVFLKKNKKRWKKISGEKINLATGVLHGRVVLISTLYKEENYYKQNKRKNIQQSLWFWRWKSRDRDRYRGRRFSFC
jgi:hypothetical protein